MPKQSVILNAVLILVMGSTLTGCTTLNKTASSLGINFWEKGPVKAPCKSNASADVVVVSCVGIKFERPQDDEILKLRGRYGSGEFVSLTP